MKTTRTSWNGKYPAVFFFFMAHLLPGSCHPRHEIFGENDCIHLDVPLEVRINGDRINGLVISPTCKRGILGL